MQWCRGRGCSGAGGEGCSGAGGGGCSGAGGGGCSGAVTLVRLHGKAHTHTSSRRVLDACNRLQWKEKGCL